MFTIHTVRRWRCKKNAFCRWASPPYKWESSLHLNLLVQRPQPRLKQTKVSVGLQRALQVPNKLGSRRGSTAPRIKCENCQGPVESVVEIDNLPEILIIVRDTEELAPGDEPDIPYTAQLNLSGIVSGPDDYTDPKIFDLVAGVGEYCYTRNTSRSCAFARGGAEGLHDRWYCILDESVVELSFEQLESLQRPPVDGNLTNTYWPILPEIFIYRRQDYGERTKEIDAFGPTSPIDGNLMKRDMMSRSINDIFTQKIGKGLLKFKVKISPADPLPQEILEVDLKVSYELEGKHYGIKQEDKQNFVSLQLHPLNGEDQASFNAVISPFEGRAIDRAVSRYKGIYPATKDEGLEQMRQTAAVHGLPSVCSCP